MEARTVQLVLHYDGGAFAGWQRQRTERTVQGVVEETLARVCATTVPVIGAGRTDEARRAAAAFATRFPRSVLLPTVTEGSGSSER